MATAARAVSTLEVTAAPDVMDLHSDGGFDIDIELQSASGDRQDDDLSLHDAGTDNGLEVQTASADQDDFMVDHEDLIDADEINFNGDLIAPVPEPSMIQSAAPRSDVFVAEEDLIDYSDDEEQPSWVDHVDIPNTPVQSGLDEPAGHDNTEQNVVQEPLKAIESTVDDEPVQEYQEEAGYEQESAEHVDQPWQPESERYASPPGPKGGGDSYAKDEHYEHAPQQGEDEQYVDENAVSQDEHSRVDDYILKEQSDAQDYDKQSHDTHPTSVRNGQQTQADQAVLSHRVTINYEGSELWLFKHHDLEDSGDFLVEDGSAFSSGINNLFDSCRTALDGAVTNDLELGLRFDHFFNMELWQDSCACPFIKLEDLVRWYLQLHAQDGNSDPDSFYMTLLSRPRVVGMYNALKGAVEGGIGFTALGNAIAAGETAFNACLKHDSTEHGYESSENGEQEQESHGNGGTDQHEDELREQDYERPSGEGHEESYEEHQEEFNEESYYEEEGVEYTQEQYPDNEHSVSQAASVNNRPVAADDKGSPHDWHKSGDAGEKNRAQSHTESAPATGSNYQEEEDLIDYSDDEDQTVNPTGAASANQPSSSSSTVQGDETDHIHEQTQGSANNAGAGEHDGQAASGYDEGDTGNATDQYQGVDANQQEFDDQAYGEEYEEYDHGYAEDQFADVQEIEGYPPHDNDENTNYYDDFGDQSLDQHAEPTLIAGVDEYSSHETRSFISVADPTALTGTFAGDDLVDFDNTAADANIPAQDQVGGVPEDEINFDDEEEDGAVGQAPVDASAAADPLVASSGVQNLSPQGQKRTIDEVGNDVGEATGITDVKRPRV